MRLRLQFPRETGLILRWDGKVGNTFQTKYGNGPSCRDQEGSSGSDKVVPRTSVILSSETGMLENFLGPIRVQSTISTIKTERGTFLETL